MILTMVLPFGMAYMMIERRLLNRPVAADPSEPLPDGPAKLLARMSSRLGGEVLALQGEDHYVRVHTPVGSELLLMRMGDAIDELSGVDGERVHRSWWVARDAVGDVRANGRKLTLTLSNGIEVPVSRDAATRMRRAGWLKR
jgi:DNA-binding LytR/AlgR family response regulator